MIDVGHLFAQHHRAIFGFLYCRTGDPELSEDLTSTTFERALRTAGNWEDRGRPAKAFLYRTAVNLLLDHRKARSTRSTVALEAASHRAVVDAGATHHLDRLDLDRELARLLPKPRAVLVERYLVGRSHAETAALLDVSEHALKKLRDRALARLRERMEAVA